MKTRMTAAAVLAFGLLIPPSTMAQQVEPTVSNEESRFDIWEYQIEGNSVLPATVIERAVYPYLGPGKSIEAVENARVELEKTYRESGYPAVLVSIPEQKVDGGVVRLKVTEGKIESLRVVGARYYSQGRIRERVRAATPGSVPYFPDVQAQLNSVNRFPGRSVSPVLRPGKQAGSTEMELNVEEKRPYGGNLELNNRYSPNTSRTRLNGSARYENLWQREHTASLQFQTAPEEPSEAKVLSLSYLMPSENSDRLYAFYAVKSDSSVAALSDITVLGKGKIFGARAILPLTGAANWNHSVTLGVDYKDFDENVGQPGTGGIQTPIQYLPFTITYDATLQDPRGYWQVSHGLNFAVRGLVSDQEEFASKRFKARDNYVAWKYDVKRVQKLPHDFSLLLRLDGQIADQPLVANEQYVAGGVDSVRGYLESEKAGDEAVHAVIEMRTPSVAGKWSSLVDDLSFHAFLEGARLSIKDALPAQVERSDLASAGLGLRIKAWKKVDAGLDLAWPFISTAYTESADPRLHFSVRMEF